MNQLKRLFVVSFFFVFIWAVNVSCLRGHISGSSSISSRIHSHDGSNDLSKEKKNDDHADSLDKAGEEIAEKLVNGIVSALQQSASSSFVEGGVSFDFKKEAKAQAKNILREVMRGGLKPLEEIVAKSVKPPVIKSEVYTLVKPAIVTLFNKVEKAVKVDVSDEIWDSSASDDNESPEEGEDISDDDLDF